MTSAIVIIIMNILITDKSSSFPMPSSSAKFRTNFYINFDGVLRMFYRRFSYAINFFLFLLFRATDAKALEHVNLCCKMFSFWRKSCSHDEGCAERTTTWNPKYSPVSRFLFLFCSCCCCCCLCWFLISSSLAFFSYFVGWWSLELLPYVDAAADDVDVVE